MNMQNRVLKKVKGLRIYWDDKNPLVPNSTPLNGKMSHKNPVYRVMAPKIWQDASGLLFGDRPLRWLIKLDVIFRYPNGQEQHEQREIEGRGTIEQLTEYYVDSIKDAMRCGNMQHYVTTKFDIECLGQ